MKQLSLGGDYVLHLSRCIVLKHISSGRFKLETLKLAVKIYIEIPPNKLWTHREMWTHYGPQTLLLPLLLLLLLHVGISLYHGISFCTRSRNINIKICNFQNRIIWSQYYHTRVEITTTMNNFKFIQNNFSTWSVICKILSDLKFIIFWETFFHIFVQIVKKFLLLHFVFNRFYSIKNILIDHYILYIINEPFPAFTFILFWCLNQWSFQNNR